LCGVSRPDAGSKDGNMPVVAMDDFETQVRHLRDGGLTPKLIARKLGVPLPMVTKVVAQVAAQRLPSDDVVGCWVSPGWSGELVIAPGRHWPDGDHGWNDAPGIVAVLVARRHRYDKVIVCGYLVDVHCLGVKNTLGPQVMDARILAQFCRTYFEAYEGEPVPAPLELAQHLVLGAIEYAHGLGFEPHPDFSATAAHLGNWAGPSAITFGRDGKPFYMQGPYDDAFAVLRTLDRTIGRDKYHYVVGVG
jgi:hypothetical protein